MNSPGLESFPQPESNDAATVPAALDALRRANDEEGASEACDAFLWAVGNNHAGTYFPVVLGVLPELERILAEGRAWAQRAVIEVLIDLGGTFIPEPGHESHLGTSVHAEIASFIQKLRPRVAALAEGTDALASSASDLLELIDDRA